MTECSAEAQAVTHRPKIIMNGSGVDSCSPNKYKFNRRVYQKWAFLPSRHQCFSLEPSLSQHASRPHHRDCYQTRKEYSLLVD